MMEHENPMREAPSENPTEETPGAAAATAQPAPETDASAPLFRLYFLRHAPAGERADWDGPDDARPLSEKGRKKMKREGKALRDIIGKPDAIVSSPYARAVETAEIVATSLRYTGNVELNDHLVHGGHPEMLASLLASHAGEKDLVLVGHSPDLERWIAWLTTGREDATFLELKKGGVARVDVRELSPAPRGVVKWVLAPGMMDG